MGARIIEEKSKNLIGDNVKYYRELRKMSQHDVSIKLETLGIYVCRGSISRIEDKTRTVTDIELLGLSNVLGTSPSELLPEKTSDFLQ